ncbi:hypothetical protein FKV24_003095 [Lysobacter maris]|uniref:Uncharacterized protein n=1 Tax=Marilutibacter maris TaxID=1605891 RepID=A0A508B228_9GAMM|nr:hypothetical protein [Lysobacter maris]KAB8198239.1 hypothetical protein FKV24_003095 [Lysobacter maris]
MRCISSVFIFILALVVNVGSASSPANRPVNVLFEAAEAVVTGRVVNVEASCGDRASVCVRMYRVLFDDGSMRELKAAKDRHGYRSVCSTVPLEIGSVYTVFMELPTRFNAGGASGCSLVVDLDGVFERMNHSVYRVGSPDARIIVDFEGNKYLTNAMVEPDFDDAIRSLTQGD